jgi:hypothetical protein
MQLMPTSSWTRGNGVLAISIGLSIDWNARKEGWDFEIGKAKCIIHLYHTPTNCLLIK